MQLILGHDNVVSPSPQRVSGAEGASLSLKERRVALGGEGGPFPDKQHPFSAGGRESRRDATPRLHNASSCADHYTISTVLSGQGKRPETVLPSLNFIRACVVTSPCGSSL